MFEYVTRLGLNASLGRCTSRFRPKYVTLNKAQQRVMTSVDKF